MTNWKIFAVNPGSTSTKIALFEGKKEVFSKTINHDAEKLNEFHEISDQLDYRKEVIKRALNDAGISLADVDAFVGRGGGLLAVEGGTYKINSTLLHDAKIGANGVQHPAQLGSQIANEFAQMYGKPAFVVNPPDTDELQDVARLTGIKGVYRNVHLHALNLKETAIRHASSQGKKYEEQNYIVCHLGGGLSVSAHRKGKMIDGNDIVGGEGPMAPTRCGAVPVTEVIKLCFKENADQKSLKKLAMKTGGLVSHLGTSDARKVQKMIANGDKYAALVWNSMIYQICKYIGAMSCALDGKVDAILLGGGMVHDEDLVKAIRKSCEWIAPVYAYPGEFEMEAMAAGTIRVLNGEEKAKEYTGKPRWSGFQF